MPSYDEIAGILDLRNATIRELVSQRDAALSDLARLRAGIADLAAGWAPWVTPQCAEALRRLLENEAVPTKEASDE